MRAKQQKRAGLKPRINNHQMKEPRRAAKEHQIRSPVPHATKESVSGYCVAR